MGSVKDTTILVKAFENLQGVGQFIFSDRYSVKDWGEMPDEIKHKGVALAVMAAFNFEQLKKKGIFSHYQGLSRAGRLLSFDELGDGGMGSNVMQFKLGRVYKPIERLNYNGETQKEEATYDYSFFDVNRGEINNFVVPLEIIFRNGLPKGSSVFKKIERAKEYEDPVDRELELKKVYEPLGLTSEPKEGDMLPQPTIDYTTKFEPTDRKLSDSEAYKVSGLPEQVFVEVRRTALAANNYINERVQQTGLGNHWDGKVEVLYFNGQIYLVDVVGTPDENRIGDYNKEVLRQYYDKNQPEWVAAIEEFKGTGEGWQDKCPIKPKNLPPELTKLVSEMYMAVCNQYVGREIFTDVRDLDRVMQDIRPLRD